ncbi:MAG: methylmalonyl Co-A mutase-associated GTPase MeaB [Cyclobacteriaceae bacterium]
MNKRKFGIKEIQEGILSGSRQWLSRGITLVESQLHEDRQASSELIDALITSSGGSLRIGITGVPGVGKSTFIEAFGTFLTDQGKKLAVLSVDPSSTLTKGSILGDKTRMAELSMNENAFIRPSPSGNSLGGVASSTRESILLCEAAGFDVVIVETVGVGQSETLVKEMVDFFLLLMLPGSGDELQGIKRGIMEMADGIFINKADGNAERAKRARKDFQNALHLYPPNRSGWKIPVEMGSALEKKGMEEMWSQLSAFEKLTKENGFFEGQRKEQQIKWFHQLIRQKLENDFFSSDEVTDKIKKAEAGIASAQCSVRRAVSDLFA